MSERMGMIRHSYRTEGGTVVTVWLQDLMPFSEARTKATMLALLDITEFADAIREEDVPASVLEPARKKLAADRARQLEFQLPPGSSER
jgi:hypothetical protein